MPGASQASVFINEVAWMGSVDSANLEWIELYNEGGAVAVDGWVLTDGRNLSIELAGTITAQSYAVLERTSDASAPGSAFFIYTGALPNTGATLRLENAQGQLVDLVSGGENWESIGGDNTTKETAQYSQKGWVTASPTPGSINATESTPTEPTEETEEEEETESSGAPKKSQKSVQTVRLTLPDVTLSLTIDAQSVGYVNQSIQFTSRAGGIGKTLLDSLLYQWNFGDGTTASSAQTVHQFSYPGTYVVTLHAQYKRQKQTTRHEITILPVAVSLTRNSAGDIQINNDSPYEIDISQYRLKGEKEFVFPAYSILLPQQTITIPYKKVATSKQRMIALYDTQGTQLATHVPSALISLARLVSSPSQSASVHTSNPTRVPASVVNPAPAQISLATDNPAAQPEAEVLVQNNPVTNEATKVLAPVASDSMLRSERLSYVGLVSIILLGIFAVYLAPRRTEASADVL